MNRTWDRKSGTFRIVAMDATDPPVARKKIMVLIDKAKTCRRNVTGTDIPNDKIRYVITRKPRAGTLIRKRGLIVTYRPKRRFTGTVTFQYAIFEDRTRSKTATVTLRVVSGNVAVEL